jgi:ankyrin repeat protein
MAPSTTIGAARSRHICCHQDLAALLLAGGADVDAKNNKGETALRYAARNGFEDVIELLLQHGCHEIPGVDVTDDGAASIESFRNAAEKGDLKRIKTQLKYNSDLVFTKDFNGWTPLHYAVSRGRRDLAELLLANEADVNARDKNGAMPLLWAAKSGHRDLAELLLASKADVNAKESDYAKTSLHFAAEEGHQDVAKLLLAGKADVDAKNNIDATPLHFAAFKGHSDVAKLLLACGADVNAKESKYGQTPFQLAATEGHKDVSELFRGHHATLSRSLRIENQEPIAASSPDPEGIDDISNEQKRWRNQAIIFVVATLIVLLRCC